MISTSLHPLPPFVYIYVCSFQTSGPTSLPAMASLLSLYWMVAEHSVEFSWVQQFSLSFLCLFLSTLLRSQEQRAVLQARNPKSLHCWAQSQISLFGSDLIKISKCGEFFPSVILPGFLKIFIYSLLTVLGLHCLGWFFFSCGEQGDSLLLVRRLVAAMVSFVVEHKL